MVPVLSIIFMILVACFCIFFPIALLIFVKIKYKAGIAPFFLGWAGFFLFALVLEQIMHFIVLKAFPGITNNLIIYALYGGFAAGIFEETARLIIMKFVLKKWHNNDANALSYGIGHGGFEAMAIISLSQISNVVTSFMINMGMSEMLYAGQTDQAVVDAVSQSISTLIETPSYMFILGGVERISAIAFHICASVIVWLAVTRGKKIWLYPVAILLHALFDIAAVMCSGLGMNTILIEVLLLVIVGAIAVGTCLLYKALSGDKNERTA